MMFSSQIYVLRAHVVTEMPSGNADHYDAVMAKNRKKYLRDLEIEFLPRSFSHQRSGKRRGYVLFETLQEFRAYSVDGISRDSCVQSHYAGQEAPFI
jgi:hypothetical protein